MQTDLVAERVNPAELPYDLAPEGVIELAVNQHEVGGDHAGRVFHLGQLN
jgi:hypothetical protein